MAVTFIEGAVIFIGEAITFIKRAVMFIEGAVTFIRGAVIFIGGAVTFISKRGLAVGRLFKIAKVRVNNIKGVNKCDLNQ